MDNLLVTKFVLYFVLIVCVSTFDMPSARVKRSRAKEWYASNKEDVCAAHNNYYAANVEKCKEASKQAYDKNPDRKRT